MKLFRILSFFLLIDISSFGQDIDIRPVDNNPRLTIEESAWLNKNIKPGSFNFDGKYVGFMELMSGGYWGIGKWTLPLTKKAFFRGRLNNCLYQLYILNAEEKKQTNGLDAVVVIAGKQIRGKMRRLKRADAIADARNGFPQIPADAGTDNSPLLNQANAEFLNELYKYGRYVTSPLNFSGKKVAIFEQNYSQRPINAEQRSISEYLHRVKRRLDESGYCDPEFTYLLTEQQKKESGGYDVIILYRDKKGVTLDQLIKKLNTSGT
ncbi:MAG TPA: hypothetical protein VHC48_14965 [Puia sp.]|nr:hypothetical protein [Puia sp.]